MSWIKRNLIFVISAAVAVVLLGLAGWYLYGSWNLNTENGTKLEAAYSELTRLSNLNPNPGNDKVDNTKNARDSEALVRQKIKEEQKFFVPIESIPPDKNVSSEAFTGALRRTVDELTRLAANSSVTIPPRYDFSFAAERPQVRFETNSLEPLSEQLGEVRAICNVLFAAKINTLYNLRRVRVCAYDSSGPQTDYLEYTPATNDLAVLVPYEVTFFGFSGEVAGVLAGFANQPHGFVVTTLNVEPATASANSAETGAPGAPGYGVPPGAYGVPGYAQGYPPGYGVPPATPPVTVQTARGGMQVILDEKQLKVTMGISIVKLLPKK
jgi:hypothetical protein